MMDHFSILCAMHDVILTLNVLVYEVEEVFPWTKLTEVMIWFDLC